MFLWLFSFQFVLLSVPAKLTSILCCSCISIFQKREGGGGGGGGLEYEIHVNIGY